MRIGLIIFSIILITAGFLLIISMNNYVSSCQTGLGKIAGFFSQSYSSECNTYNFLLIAGYGILILGAISFIIGIASSRKSKYEKEQHSSEDSSEKKGSNFCEECGHSINKGKKFCKHCGTEQ